jgi:hypothetical protein
MGPVDDRRHDTTCPEVGGHGLASAIPLPARWHLFYTRVFHPNPSAPSTTMAPLADFILANVPLPSVPSYLTQWEPGTTPLSTQKEVATALVSYLAVIFSIQTLMKDKQPVKANAPFQVHNTILYIGSGILLALIVEEILPIWWRGNWFSAMCDSKSWTSVTFAFALMYLVVSDQTLRRDWSSST